MPGKPYDREFEKRRWAMVAEQQAAYDLALTDEEKARDTAWLFNAWRWRFLELGESAEPLEPSGWIEFHKRYAAKQSTS